MSKLILFMPDGTSLDVPLNRERLAIGRRADNDICLPNLAVSGEHAVVVTILADSFLEDLGSTNGTLVNGKPIAKHFLRDRDQIEIGRHKLIYCTEDDAVIDAGVAKRLSRSAARELGEMVSAGKPFVRGKQGTAAAASPAEEPAAAERTAPTPAVERAGPIPAVGHPGPGSKHTGAGSGRGPSAINERAAAPAPPRGPSIKVLTGAKAGTSMPLTKAETTIGRPGIQVATIVKAGGSFLIRQMECERAPAVNGQPVVQAGTALAHGDQIDIAGTRLEFVATEQSQLGAAASGERADVKEGA